jgi:hypothetical protein
MDEWWNSPDGRYRALQAAKEQGQREVFERCCKEMCRLCAEGNEATSVAGFAAWVHVVKGFIQPINCRAAAIHDLEVAAFPQFSKPGEGK